VHSVTGLPPYSRPAATARRCDIWPLIPAVRPAPALTACGPTGYAHADVAKADKERYNLSERRRS